MYATSKFLFTVLCVIFTFATFRHYMNDTASLITCICSGLGWLLTAGIFFTLIENLLEGQKYEAIKVIGIEVGLCALGFIIGHWGLHLTQSWDIACGCGSALIYGSLALIVLVFLAYQFLRELNWVITRDLLKNICINMGSIIGTIIIIALIIVLLIYTF